MDLKLNWEADGISAIYVSTFGVGLVSRDESISDKTSKAGMVPRRNANICLV